MIYFISIIAIISSFSIFAEENACTDIQPFEDALSTIIQLGTTAQDREYCAAFSRCRKEFDRISGELPLSTDPQDFKDKGLSAAQLAFKIDLHERMNADREYSSSEERCLNDLKVLNNLCSEVRTRDVHVIKFYTDSGYTYMNPPNWSSKHPECKAFGDYLDEALSNFPSQERWVTRGTNLPVKIRDEHKVGKIVQYPAFTSASVDDGWQGEDEFLIYSRSGVNFDILHSNYGEDGEILFKRGSQFYILDAFKKGGKNLYVMVELSSSDSGDFVNEFKKTKYNEIKAKLKKLKKSSPRTKENTFVEFGFGSSSKENLWKCANPGPIVDLTF